jgi:hypothetical protein
MKKLLLVLAIGAFVACNDNAGTDETKTDSLPVVDTATTVIVDTTSTGPVVDTTVKAVDTIKK